MRKLYPINYAGVALIIASIWIIIYVSIVYWWIPFMGGLILLFYKPKMKQDVKQIN